MLVVVRSVCRIDVDGEPIGAVIGRSHGDIAECIGPFAEHAGTAESACDFLQHGYPSLQHFRKGFAVVGIFRLRHVFGGCADHLGEKGLVALEQRPDIGGRSGKRGLQRLLDLRRQFLMVAVLAGLWLDERIRASAQIEQGRRAAEGGVGIVDVESVGGNGREEGRGDGNRRQMAQRGHGNQALKTGGRRRPPLKSRHGRVRFSAGRAGG
jgi:hypothetical protein